MTGLVRGLFVPAVFHLFSNQLSQSGANAQTALQSKFCFDIFRFQSTWVPFINCTRQELSVFYRQLFERDRPLWYIFSRSSWGPSMTGAKNNLSEYVKRVMKLKGLTQKDVQKMSGRRITDGYVASITTGRAKNLSVDKLMALADGLGVDTDELFHVACGDENLDADVKRRTSPDPLTILETVQQAVMNPAVTQILHEVVRLSAEERAGLLLFIKRLGSTKRKSRRKPKSD